MADRAMSPVVGKAMEATLVVLYIGLVTATLYGGTIPEYRTAAGGEVAERTATNAASEIQDAVPPAATAGEARVNVEVPATIRGDQYRIRADADRVVLDHPSPDVSTSVPLTLPERVTNVSGTWSSSGSTSVVVTVTDGTVEVRLE